MTKIVVNRDFGGFSLSEKAMIRYRELGGVGEDYWDIPRDNSCLVQVVEELGDEANGDHADLHVVEIPDDVAWMIHDYDGMETIHERHRVW